MNTLDRAMEILKIDKVEDTARQRTHCFGNYDDEQPSLFSVKMPFSSKKANGSKGVEFDVAFDVIEGDLPFLLGLPSLIATGASVHLKVLTISLNCNAKYHRLQMVKHGDHVYLPFESTSVDLQTNNDAEGSNSGRGYYRRPQAPHQSTTRALLGNGTNFYSGTYSANNTSSPQCPPVKDTTTVGVIVPLNPPNTVRLGITCHEQEVWLETMTAVVRTTTRNVAQTTEKNYRTQTRAIVEAEVAKHRSSPSQKIKTATKITLWHVLILSHTARTTTIAIPPQRHQPNF